MNFLSVGPLIIFLFHFVIAKAFRHCCLIGCLCFRNKVTWLVLFSSEWSLHFLTSFDRFLDIVSFFQGSKDRSPEYKLLNSLDERFLGHSRGRHDLNGWHCPFIQLFCMVWFSRLRFKSFNFTVSLNWSKESLYVIFNVNFLVTRFFQVRGEEWIGLHLVSYLLEGFGFRDKNELTIL